MKKKFYPHYLTEIIFFAFLTFELILVLSLLFSPKIGREIDFQVPYQPRPEWYYLWLFWLLRYFPSDKVFIGGILIPLSIICFFMLIPWIERKLEWKLTAILALGLLLFLTIITIIEIFS